MMAILLTTWKNLGVNPEGQDEQWAATGIPMDDVETNNKRNNQITKHRGNAANSGRITSNG